MSERKVLDLSELKGQVINLQELTDKITIDGQKVFSNIKTDPETGDLLDYELTPEMQERLDTKAAEIQAAAEELLKGSKAKAAQTRKAIEDAKAQASEAIEAIKAIIHSPLTAETREQLRKVVSIFDELNALTPYIEAELKKPEYNGITLDELLEEVTPAQLLELPEDSVLYKVIKAARSAAETQITAYKADRLDLPTDKLNLFAWDLKDTRGQIRFDLSRAGSSDGAFAKFALTFDDDPNIKLTKQIDHFDKRVMSACGTAYANGSPIISATGIYYAMGNTGKPAQKQIEKINDSLTKLDMAKVFVDNSIEAEIYNYPEFVVKEDRLLHFKRVSRVVNGKTSDAIIQILEEPVLMTFARQRKQISAIPIQVLQTPARRTNNYYQIEDYLLWRIAQQKNVVKKLKDQQDKRYTQDRQRKIRESAKLTILLSTFYERTGNKSKDATGKKRARKTAEECLTHYKSDAGGKWIEGYKMERDRIVIDLPTR